MADRFDEMAIELFGEWKIDASKKDVDLERMIAAALRRVADEENEACAAIADPQSEKISYETGACEVNKDSTGRIICSPEQPYVDKKDGAQWVHPAAKDVGTCYEGCCDDYECAVCGLRFRVENAQ